MARRMLVSARVLNYRFDGPQPRLDWLRIEAWANSRGEYFLRDSFDAQAEPTQYGTLGQLITAAQSAMHEALNEVPEPTGA